MTAIVPYGNGSLRTKARVVSSFDADLGLLLDKMAVEMHAANGVGLSANQIGRPEAACIIEVDGKLVEMINPEIWDGFTATPMLEGCLSIPGYSDRVDRWTELEGSAYDREGRSFQFQATDTFAHVIQHEVDHLNGLLYIDRLDPALQKKFWQFWWGDES